MAPPRSFEGTKLGIVAVCIAALGFVVAYRYASPAPPDTIRLAAGQPGGAYSLFAEKYRSVLARNGVEIQIVRSTGSRDNLRLLSRGDVDIALAQAGVATAEQHEELQSLGSLFHEPLWIFIRRDLEVDFLSQLRGRRLQIGPVGSGTRALVIQLLTRNGLEDSNAEWLDDPSTHAASSLQNREVDAVFLVGSVDSPVIRSLVYRPDVRLLGMKRAEAYTRLNWSLSKQMLPEGVLDLEHNIPAADTVLVASVAELVIGPDFHPALVDLLLQAADEIHGTGDIFAEPGAFPSSRFVDLPLSPEANRYFEHGPPVLQRYLPFWAATQIDRLKVMLIPLIALLVPLVRVFPPTYRWRVRSRIYRWYKELRLADPGPTSQLDAEEIGSRLADLCRIERDVAKVPTPTSYAEELYSLRLHIDFVRKQLESAQEQLAAQSSITTKK